MSIAERRQIVIGFCFSAARRSGVNVRTVRAAPLKNKSKEGRGCGSIDMSLLTELCRLYPTSCGK